MFNRSPLVHRSCKLIQDSDQSRTTSESVHICWAGQQIFCPKRPRRLSQLNIHTLNIPQQIFWILLDNCFECFQTNILTIQTNILNILKASSEFDSAKYPYFEHSPTISKRSNVRPGVHHFGKIAFQSFRCMWKTHPWVSAENWEILNLWFDDVQVNVCFFHLGEW